MNMSSRSLEIKMLPYLSALFDLAPLLRWRRHCYFAFDATMLMVNKDFTV